MKIGILSMQRVVNYGSFLQAYALREVLTNLGHECYFVDIKPGKKIAGNDSNKIKKNKLIFVFKRIDRYILKRIKHKFYSKERVNRFSNEFFPMLGLGQELSYNSDYDAIVIGSDEVFNCTQNSNWGLAKTLLGEGLDSDIIISYAASCGHTTIDKVNKLRINDDITNAMENFKVISVRDKNTKKLVQKFTNKPTYEHIDPTLIYDFDGLVPESISESNYILVYAYDGRINDRKTINEVREFAKKRNKIVISAGLYQSWCDKQILCTPFELLSYFKNADYIVTDTFHGTVFSIKYNKQFVTIIRESNKQKLGDLLAKFDLVERAVEHPERIPRKLVNEINYHETNFKICNYKNSAFDYFNKYLKETK